MTNTTTTADKGELLPLPEPVFKQVGVEQGTNRRVQIGNYTADQMREYALANMNRRPTNEGQDGLTDEELHHLTPRSYPMQTVAQAQELIKNVARHLSSKKASPAEVEGKLTDDEMIDLCSEAMVDANLPPKFCLQNPSMLFGYGKACIERAHNQRLAVKEGASCTSQEPHICRHHPDGNIAYQLAAELDELKDDQQAKDAALEKLMVELLSLGSNADRASSYEETCAIDDRIIYVKAQIRALSVTKQEEV